MFRMLGDWIRGKWHFYREAVSMLETCINISVLTMTLLVLCTKDFDGYHCGVVPGCPTQDIN